MGYERIRCAKAANATPLTTNPIVKMSEESDAWSAPSDQRSPTTSICAPVRFVGRRAAAIVPVTVNTSPAISTSAKRSSVCGSRDSAVMTRTRAPAYSAVPSATAAASRPRVT